MNTAMESRKIIENCKKGELPEILVKELPEISELIKTMTSICPNARPALSVF